MARGGMEWGHHSPNSEDHALTRARVKSGEGLPSAAAEESEEEVLSASPTFLSAAAAAAGISSLQQTPMATEQRALQRRDSCTEILVKKERLYAPLADWTSRGMKGAFFGRFWTERTFW